MKNGNKYICSLITGSVHLLQKSEPSGVHFVFWSISVHTLCTKVVRRGTRQRGRWRTQLVRHIQAVSAGLYMVRKRSGWMTRKPEAKRSTLEFQKHLAIKFKTHSSGSLNKEHIQTSAYF